MRNRIQPAHPRWVLRKRDLGLWFVFGAFCACALVASAVSEGWSAEPTKTSLPSEQKELSITIYNNDLGLVIDVRSLTVSRGIVDLRFEGVAARIDPTSVYIRSLNHPDELAILEQNFEYDLISPAKLMEKYLGREVELITRVDDKEVSKQARLIGNQGGYVYEMDGKIAINPPGRVVAPELPEGLISQPTLVWLLDSGRPDHTVEASYLTSGIGWHANYVMVLGRDVALARQALAHVGLVARVSEAAVLGRDDKKVDLSGWVTIENSSGATYKDASIKLVAGDIHRAPQELPTGGRVARVMSAEVTPQFKESAFFEYHLYTLGRKTTVKDNQTKQISLLSAEDASVKKSYIYQARQPYWFAAMSGPEKGTKVGVFLSLENTKKNKLGMPLPKGVVRVYKKDEDGALQFVGEDAIDHTPEDETVRVKVGDAFDIVAERTQTQFRVLQSGHLYESSYKVEIRNHKDEDVVVSVVEIVPGDWDILENSHNYEKEASNRIRFDVPVTKKSSSELTYSVRIKY